MSTRTGKTILLVEDEVLIAMSARMTLERLGYDAVLAHSGEKAIETVSKHPSIDLILMDIDLGAGIDGTEAARIILQDRDVPVVFLSSHTEPEVVEKTEKITSYGYVVKNSNTTVLDASIKMAFKLFEAKRKVTEELSIRRATETALQESEEKFRALFEKGPIGVAYHEMIYDQAGQAVDYRFLDANTSYRELTGVDPRGKLVTEVFPGIENDPFDWIGTFGRVAQTGEQIRFEQYLQPNNRWYDCVAYQVKPDHFVAAFMEVTKHKQAEKRLIESEARFRSIIAVSNTGAWEYHRDTGFLWCSPEYFSMLGRDPGDFAMDGSANLAESWVQLIHPEDQDRAAVHFAEYLAGGSVGMYENRFRMQHQNGSWVWIWSRGQSLRDSAGNLTNLTVGTHIDITEQKNFQQQLAEQNAFLDAVLDNMLDLVAVTDMTGTFLYAGRSHERLGYHSSSLIGQNIMDLVHPDDREYVMGEFSTFLEDGNDRPAELRCLCADGSYTWLETRCRFLHSENGEPSRILFNSSDVSDRKQVLADKDLLIREIQHRIKNNINTMTSLLSIQAEGLKEASAVAALHEARSRLNSLGVLYTQLYDAGGSAHGSLQGYLQHLIASEMEVFGFSSRVDVHLSIEEHVFTARTLSTLGLLVNELITNAIKHAFREHRSPQLSVTGVHRGTSYVLTIADNGPGMPEQDRTRTSSGTGFMIIHALIGQLNGSIQFEDQEGTRVEIEIPIDMNT